MTTKYVRFLVRGCPAADHATLNEILLAREIGLETDTRRIKFGDGVTAWNSLPYQTVAAADVSGFDAAADARITAQKGVALGLAPLDASGKVDPGYMPDALIGAVRYQGTWNAATNSPSIPTAAAGNKGNYYKVATAGTTSISGIADWAVGDWIISNGASWDKIDNTDAVVSVAGLNGAIAASALKAALSIGPTDLTGLASGIAAFLANPTSANLAAAMTDEKGTGSFLRGETITFAPQLTFGGGSTGLLTSWSDGWVKKRGDETGFSVSVKLTGAAGAKGTSAGVAEIILPVSGLSALNADFAVFPCEMTGMNFAGDFMYGKISVGGGTTKLTFGGIQAGTRTWPFTDAHFTDGSMLTVSGSYRHAA